MDNRFGYRQVRHSEQTIGDINSLVLRIGPVLDKIFSHDLHGPRVNKLIGRRNNNYLRVVLYCWKNKKVLLSLPTLTERTIAQNELFTL